MTTVAEFKRTLPEVDRAAASKKALEARVARATFKSDLIDGNIEYFDFLDDLKNNKDKVDPHLLQLRVSAFIETLPLVGPSKRKDWMEELEISSTRRMGGLGYKQIESLYAKINLWLVVHPIGSGIRGPRKVA